MAPTPPEPTPFWLTITVAALTGGLAGTVASLISPWVQGAVDKRRDALKAKRDRIAEWRAALEAASTFDDVRYSSTFAQLREFMTKEEVESLFTIWVVMGGSSGDGDRQKLAKLQEVVNRVERKWELI